MMQLFTEFSDRDGDVNDSYGSLNAVDIGRRLVSLLVVLYATSILLPRLFRARIACAACLTYIAVAVYVMHFERRAVALAAMRIVGKSTRAVCSATMTLTTTTGGGSLAAASFCRLSDATYARIVVGVFASILAGSLVTDRPHLLRLFSVLVTLFVSGGVLGRDTMVDWLDRHAWLGRRALEALTNVFPGSVPLQMMTARETDLYYTALPFLTATLRFVCSVWVFVYVYDLMRH